LRRQALSLGRAPEDPDELKHFPDRPLFQKKALFRVVRRGRCPWWFGSSMLGRFDLPAPGGTCYLAGDPIAALLEVVGADRAGGVVAAEFFVERRLCELQVPRDYTMADLTSRRAAGFGITLEVSTMVPYELPQMWAAKLRAARFEGIVHWLRHDPSRSVGWALSGRQGSAGAGVEAARSRSQASSCGDFRRTAGLLCCGFRRLRT
jgi:hypothetical protein